MFATAMFLRGAQSVQAASSSRSRAACHRAVFTVGGVVSAGVARLGELPGGNAIQLDGMATIEVIYL